MANKREIIPIPTNKTWGNKAPREIFAPTEAERRTHEKLESKVGEHTGEIQRSLVGKAGKLSELIYRDAKGDIQEYQDIESIQKALDETDRAMVKQFENPKNAPAQNNLEHHFASAFEFYIQRKKAERRITELPGNKIREQIFALEDILDGRKNVLFRKGDELFNEIRDKEPSGARAGHAPQKETAVDKESEILLRPEEANDTNN